MFGSSLSWGLSHLYSAFVGIGPLAAIGAYGLAIIALTMIVKLVLAPLLQLQLTLGKRAMEDQRRLAPEVAVLQKKHKGDPAKLNEERMKLYKEHGVNPLGAASGCLPSLLQMPIVIALYWVFFGNANSHAFPSAHFLFVPDLNARPADHQLLHGLPIPALAYLVIPLLAAGTTFVQSKMMQQKPNPHASEQEQQTQQMTQSMAYVMPAMIAIFAIQTPAGLGLYWFISNCVAIVQQYFVTGWGGLRSKSSAVPAKPMSATIKPLPQPLPRVNSTGQKRARRAKR